MRILHICQDEKFVDYAIRNFTDFNLPGIEHEFCVVVPNVKQKLKHVKGNVTVKTRADVIGSFLFGSYRSFNVVVFHSFPKYFTTISKFIRSNQLRVWIGWGFDYYCFYNKKTVLDYHEKKKRPTLKNRLQDYFYTFISYKNEYKKFDFFSPVLASEFEIFKDIVSDKTQLIEWNYGSQANLSELIVEAELGTNILLGNSSTPSNNHLDVLKKLDSLSHEIVLPLNYGDFNYRDWLLDELKGYDLCVSPIVDYLDSTRYLALLNTCNVMIMNHIRQQGAGNVGIALLSGMTVYLNEESPLYVELIRKGFHILRTQDIEQGQEIKHLSEDDIFANKKLAKEVFNSSVTQTKTHEMLKMLRTYVMKVEV